MPESGRRRLRDVRQILGIFGAILVVALFASALGPREARAGSGHLGAAGPDFVATSADGTPLRLSDMRGHPVWLSFFSTWCANCRAEDPDIDLVVKDEQAAGRDLAFLAVGVGETPRTVAEYARNAGLSFPFAADPERSASRRYAVLALPTHVFLDRDGIVRDVRIGALQPGEMRALVAAIERAR